GALVSKASSLPVPPRPPQTLQEYVLPHGAGGGVGMGWGKVYLSCPSRAQRRQKHIRGGVLSSYGPFHWRVGPLRRGSSATVSGEEIRPVNQAVWGRTRSIGPKRPNSRSRSCSFAS